MKIATEDGVRVDDGIKVEVDAMDLQNLLQGLLDGGFTVREWQATFRFDMDRKADHNPIVNLANQYNAWVAAQRAEAEASKEGAANESAD